MSTPTAMNGHARLPLWRIARGEVAISGTPKIQELCICSLACSVALVAPAESPSTRSTACAVMSSPQSSAYSVVGRVNTVHVRNEEILDSPCSLEGTMRARTFGPVLELVSSWHCTQA